MVNVLFSFPDYTRLSTSSQEKATKTRSLRYLKPQIVPTPCPTAECHYHPTVFNYRPVENIVELQSEQR
eukprot:2066543-Amphidinium_carterae.1